MLSDVVGPAMNDDKILLLPLEDKPTRADAIRNRRRLLETAQRLFDAGQFAVITMSDIAKEAGVGKGTLYRHFNDKSDICHALLDQAIRDFQARTLERLSAPDTPAEKLRWFLGEVVTYVDRHIVLLYEASQTTTRTELMQHPAHYWWRQTIAGLLEQMDPAGDRGYMVDLLYVMTDADTIRYLRQMQGYALERIIAGLWLTFERLCQLEA